MKDTFIVTLVLVISKPALRDDGFHISPARGVVACCPVVYPDRYASRDEGPTDHIAIGYRLILSELAGKSLMDSEMTAFCYF